MQELVNEAESRHVSKLTWYPSLTGSSQAEVGEEVKIDQEPERISLGMPALIMSSLPDSSKSRTSLSSFDHVIRQLSLY